ncbi:MAG TPA: hypothetical protein G4O08_05965 [Anaerolineae bacterium]|nr:hypothetical protein [Anaerolineae bacterium]
MNDIHILPTSERKQLAELLALGSAADAMVAYYALDHSGDRVTLYTHGPENSLPRAFLVMARTGLDLFRPLVVPFVGQAESLEALLQAALKPEMPVLLDLPIGQKSWAQEIVDLEGVKDAELLRLDVSIFVPQINVLVVESITPDGWPRFEIRSGEVLQAAAGLNWMGEHFAEVYIEADPVAVTRGFHMAVLSMMANHLLADRIIALYRAVDDDSEGRAEAMKMGFRTTGIRLFTAQATLVQESEKTEV